MSAFAASRGTSKLSVPVQHEIRDRSAAAFNLDADIDPVLCDAIDRFVRDIGGPLAIMHSGRESTPAALARGASLSLPDLFAEAGHEGMPPLTTAAQLVLPIASADPALFLALAVGPDSNLINDSRDCERNDLIALVLRLCTGLTGAARAAERAAHAYARLRRSGGTPIWHYQAVARRLADAVIAADSAELTLLEFASQLEGATGRSHHVETLSRLRAADASELAEHIIICADIAIEEAFMVQAGHGYTMESVPARLRTFADSAGLAVRRLLETTPEPIGRDRAREIVDG